MNPANQSIQSFTPKSLAVELGISYRRVLTAIKTGELRVIQFGPRSRLIRSEDAAAWIKKLTR